MPYLHLTEILKGDKVRVHEQFWQDLLSRQRLLLQEKLPTPEILCNNYYIIF